MLQSQCPKKTANQVVVDFSPVKQVSWEGLLVEPPGGIDVAAQFHAELARREARLDDASS